MSVEDKKLARELMRELSRRRNIDLSDVRVSVSRMIGYIAGIIRPAPGEFLDPKAEMKSILDGCRRVPGLRDIVFEARFEMGTKR